MDKQEDILVWDKIRKKVEKEKKDLAKLKEDLKTERKIENLLIENMSDGLIMVNTENKIVVVNSRAEDYLATKREKLIGENAYDVLKSIFSKNTVENSKEWEKIIEFNVECPEKPTVSEITFSKPVKRVLKRLSTPVMDDDNKKILGRVVIFHDMTREREVSEIKDNIIALVSHEFRTPLTSIKGSLDLVLNGRIEDASTQREFINIASRNCARLIQLIENFLDLSKLKSGKVEIIKRDMNLSQLIDSIIYEFKPYADEKKISIIKDFGDEIPLVNADENRLRQLVLNLLSNAIKFSKTGKEVTISIKEVSYDSKEIKQGIALLDNQFLRDKQDFMKVSVIDNGVGIPADQLTKVFDIFYQVDMSATRETGGTGLGLAICKAIVEEHQGSIWVESEVGKGTKFNFIIPLLEQKKSSKKASLRKKKRTLSPEEWLEDIPKEILVVDDEPDIVSVISEYFEREGYKVFKAYNGKDALKLARKIKPDLITLDVMLPDIDGFDVASILKNDLETKHIPIIFVTIVGEGEKNKGYRLGAVDYIIKPVDPKRLLSSISEVFRKINGHIKHKKLLVVDDDPDIVKVITKSLEQNGYLTCQAYSGQEAINIIKKENPHIIILDIMMPEMDGYEVIKRLKADSQTSNIPIIVLTASDLIEGESKVMSLGADRFLKKPFSEKLLLKEIHRLVGNLNNIKPQRPQRY